jgi:AraC family transcriptional regulator
MLCQWHITSRPSEDDGQMVMPSVAWPPIHSTRWTFLSMRFDGGREEPFSDVSKIVAGERAAKNRKPRQAKRPRPTTFTLVKDETRSYYELVVGKALSRIVNDLDAALDLADLARTAALSPLHFHRIFRGMVGETPLELHRRLRLERAATRLSTSETAVTAIAFEAGYETHESFTRAFREAYSASPTEFRARGRGQCEGPPRCELAARSGVHFAEPMQARFSITRGDIMQVDIRTMPELRVAAVSHEGPYNTISEAFARLGAIVGPAGLLQHPEAAMVAIYHDSPEVTPQAELRSDAGIVVPAGLVLPRGLNELRIPAGRYAKTTHVGPYTQLGDAWTRFMGSWLPESGHRIGTGTAYEVYRNTPMTAKPEELQTDLYLSIA